MAFYRLRGDVKAYANDSEHLKKLGVDLEEWISMPPEVRKMKIEFAKKMPK